jgi:hypothetical protein
MTTGTRKGLKPEAAQLIQSFPARRILGSLLLVRKQRATKGPSAAEAKFNAGTSEAHQIRAKILSQTIAESPMDRQ